jgi:hypothetical protein
LIDFVLREGVTMKHEFAQSDALECLLKWIYEGKPISLEEFEKLCDEARREEEQKATARLAP